MLREPINSCADVLYNGPLINLAVLAHAVFERASEEVVLNIAWMTFGTLLKALRLAKLRVSAREHARFDEVRQGQVNRTA